MKARIWSIPALVICGLVAQQGRPDPPQAPAIDAAVVRLDYVWGERGLLAAERFELDREVTAAVGRLAVGERRVVLGFPIAPGERGDLELERFDVYHPSARIVVVDASGQREIGRSTRVHLVGYGLHDPEVRVGVSLDPDGGGLRGLVSHADGVFEIVELTDGRSSPSRHTYEIGREAAERRGIELRPGCDVPDAPLAFDPLAAGSAAPPPGSPAYTHEASLAFDTDGEFTNDYASPALANAAIGDLVTSLNVIYERDLGLRLFQAYTILRTDPASDPYDGTTTSAQLDEVESEWEGNQQAIPRTWTALLSGKGATGPSGCSGAGRANLDAFCDSRAYSVTKVLRCVPLDGSSNTQLIGHEVGHNAGSRHTHCYVPEVDRCYKAEGGCWAGAVSCPSHGGPIPAAKGTVMSYCHFGPPDGAGCGSNAPYFHPTVIAYIQAKIDGNTPACVGLAATCGAPANELTIGHSTDSGGPIAYSACSSLTFGPDYTATPGSTVSAEAPRIILGADVTLSGTFTASN